jgi:cob(I)alamin adenosyltransferase
LEEHIDALMKQLPERQGFVLSGGCPAACQAHICRTVCRRAERRIAALAEVAVVGPEMQQYVNRLSDYLFALAKIINFNEGVQEILWENACK